MPHRSYCLPYTILHGRFWPFERLGYETLGYPYLEMLMNNFCSLFKSAVSVPFVLLVMMMQLFLYVLKKAPVVIILFILTVNYTLTFFLSFPFFGSVLLRTKFWSYLKISGLSSMQNRGNMCNNQQLYKSGLTNFIPYWMEFRFAIGGLIQTILYKIFVGVFSVSRTVHNFTSCLICVQDFSKYFYIFHNLKFRELICRTATYYTNTELKYWQSILLITTSQIISRKFKSVRNIQILHKRNRLAIYDWSFQFFLGTGHKGLLQEVVKIYKDISSQSRIILIFYHILIIFKITGTERWAYI